MNTPANRSLQQNAVAGGILPGSDNGTVEITTSGADLAAALTSGLRTVLTFALGANQGLPGDRSTSLRGEGHDPGQVFGELVADLLEQIALHGAGIDDVQIDGVLRRDDGGFIAWGQASGSLVTGAGPVFGLIGEARYERSASGQHILTATIQRETEGQQNSW
ncbi:MAG: hypothetical protein U0031_01725 [Thermomicrobiales bacterium]